MVPNTFPTGNPHPGSIWEIRTSAHVTWQGHSEFPGLWFRGKVLGLGLYPKYGYEDTRHLYPKSYSNLMPKMSSNDIFLGYGLPKPKPYSFP